MIRVFVDASVLFSAARRGSLMARFVAKLLQVSSCVTSAYAAEEAQSNLARKFPGSVSDFSFLLRQFTLVSDEAPVPISGLAEKDRPILGGAIASACTYLLTSDRRDFGRLFGKTISGVKIVSPRMLADELVALGLLEKK